MSILPKYRNGGKRIGVDPASISKEIMDLGTYDNDINPKGYFIEEVEGFKHNTLKGEYDSPARNYFKTVSPVNDKISSKSNINQSTGKEIVDGKWHNFSGDEGQESLSRGEKVKVGNATIKVTGPYGLRKLSGRGQQHSRGMDITTSTGKAHALSDGVIESVKLQGDGSVVGTSATPAAGYYVTVKNNDGTRTQYMHLDPMTDEDIKNLIGKKLNRGDEIWSYTKGSGSMTGPHIKIRHYGNNSKYNVDPSQLIKGIAYKYIPDATGGNIFSYKQKKGLLRK